MAGSGNPIANLDAFIEKGFPDAIKKGLTEACMILEKSAKEKCPVDSGSLRRSIESEVEDNVGVVRSNVEYAPYVEIGTGIYSSEGTGRQDPWRYQDASGEWHTTEGQKPQPFMKPAMEENRSKVRDCFKEILK